MNTQLAPAEGRHDHPPQPVRSPEAHPLRRVGLVDRAAMHLGVALIHWGRRPVRARRRELHWGRRPVRARRRERPTLAPESLEARRELDRARDEYLVVKLTQFR